jgi:hypothetical protein
MSPTYPQGIMDIEIFTANKNGLKQKSIQASVSTDALLFETNQ